MTYKLPIVDTHIQINDFSIIKEQSELVNSIPLYLAAFSADKGPEELIEVNADMFFKLYGDRNSISYKRHGQPLIQAAASVEAGARVLCKRVVAEDATLANITIYAEVKTIERKIIKKKQDNKGRVQIVYEDPEKPTSDENEFLWDNEGQYVPKLIEDEKARSSVLVRFFAKSVPGVKTMSDIKKRVVAERDGAVYPLFTITDNGRGVSGKSIKIAPSFFTRAGSVSAMRHTIQVIENNEIIEEADFIFHPDVNINRVNRGMNTTINTLMSQIKCLQYEDSVNDFYDHIITTTKDPAVRTDEYLEYLKSIDILFGRNRKDYIEEVMCITSPTDTRNSQFDPSDPAKNVVNLTTPSGLLLENGSNGAFKNDPIERPEYVAQLCNFFDGKFTNEIYDLHNHKIDLIIDANYDPKVKTKIEEFVIQFRDDCCYIRDFGLGMASMQEILQTRAGFESHYKCSDYYLSYDIIDPFSAKQIPVTMTFELAELFVEHFKQGRHRPCAGIPYNFVLKRAIKGTESFIPTKHKYSDQRETLTDKRINYAIYHDSKLVVETLFTSQEEYSQLSYMNNVFNIQRLVKLIRTKCPQIRYAFMHGKDLDNYKQDIQHELNLEAGNFARLDVKFVLDKVSVTNKQIHVIVEVTCKDFIASEFFEINIINLD